MDIPKYRGVQGPLETEIESGSRSFSAGEEKIKGNIMEEVEESFSESFSSCSSFKFSKSDVAAIIMEDEDIPILTLRMWTLAICLSALALGMDCFFALRFPSVSLGAIVVQIIAHPVGCMWAYVVPKITIELPLNRRVQLNPGRFNYKEHSCIFIFNNLALSNNLVVDLVVEQYKFFNVHMTIAKTILFNMSCYLIAFGLSGFTLFALVAPTGRQWPGVLKNIALFKALYSDDDPYVKGWKTSRNKLLLVSFLSSFCFFWIPDLLMPFTSSIGAWISWCKPSSAVLSQVFGVKTGLGIFPLTLDWAQISSISNPLTIPFLSIANIFISFVFWIWIVMTAFYYTNQSLVAHYPLMTSLIYDVDGMIYQPGKVVNSNWTLNYEKFKSYSPVMLPVAFLMHFALSLATFAAIAVQFIFQFKKVVLVPSRKEISEAPSEKKKQIYNCILYYIYAVVFIAGLGMGFGFFEGIQEAPINAGEYFVAVLIALTMFVPLALIESKSNFLIDLSTLYQIISAFWFSGKPYSLLYFQSTGVLVLQHAVHLSQGFKIGIYTNIPIRANLVILFASCIWSSITGPAITGYIVRHISDLCELDAANGMSCRKQRVAFNNRLVWGLFGDKIFSTEGRYSWVLYFLLAGGLTTLIHNILIICKPKGAWRKADPVLFFAGATLIPSVTGYNYSTWFLFGFIFNFCLHRKYSSWWKKYNLVLGIGLDCGVSIAAIIIYFCIVYTGASNRLIWWGSTIEQSGCDAKGCPYLTSAIARPPSW